MRRTLIALLATMLFAISGCDALSKKELIDLSAGPPNVIIIALDTLRADHLGCYGNASVETPTLDRFASESILFEQCASTSSWTLPSFTSLFTGLMPYEHGVIGGANQILSADPVTLAGHLANHGYHTRAYTSVDYLTDAFKTTRGFEIKKERLRGKVTGRIDTYQREVLAFLGERHTKPFFLLAHYFDIHSPYDPPAPYDGMYYEGDPRDPAQSSIDVIYDEATNRIHGDPTQAYGWLEGVTDLEYPVTQYAAGVTYLDDKLAPMFDQLRNSGLMDNSIVIVMSDHGEHLTEHDLYFTHRFPFEECLHVPMIIHLPKSVGAGMRIGEDISLIDIFPTLLELLGLDSVEQSSGLSLAPLMRGETSLERDYLFAEYGGISTNMVKAVWDNDYRMFRFSIGAETWEELYDRRADPMETRNVIDELPEVRQRLSQALDDRFSPTSPLLREYGEGEDEIPEDVKERLRTLGYVD